MAELKTKPTEASVEKFLDGVADEVRRGDCFTLLALMRDATGLEPRMWGPSMVGFGAYHYRYASGHEGDSFVVGFSPRKKDLTLYLMGGLDSLQPLLSRLGKHKTSKGACLYLGRLADVDVTVLRELIAQAFDRGRRLAAGWSGAPGKT